MGRRVVAIANPAPVDRMNASQARFIAADVGGTHVRIGLVQESGDPAHPVAVLHYRKYVCAQYPGLAEIIDVHDVRVVQACQRAGFTGEAFSEAGIPGILKRKNFQRDYAVEPALPRPVNGTHPAVTEQAEDFQLWEENRERFRARWGKILRHASWQRII